MQTVDDVNDDVYNDYNDYNDSNNFSSILMKLCCFPNYSKHKCNCIQLIKYGNLFDWFRALANNWKQTIEEDTKKERIKKKKKFRIIFVVILLNFCDLFLSLVAVEQFFALNWRYCKNICNHRFVVYRYSGACVRRVCAACTKGSHTR